MTARFLALFHFFLHLKSAVSAAEFLISPCNYKPCLSTACLLSTCPARSLSRFRRAFVVHTCTVRANEVWNRECTRLSKTRSTPVLYELVRTGLPKQYVILFPCSYQKSCSSASAGLPGQYHNKIHAPGRHFRAHETRETPPQLAPPGVGTLADAGDTRA